MLDRTNLNQLPPKPNPFEQAARFLADSLAQAAGIAIQPKPTDAAQANIEIDDWHDWTRLIAGFKSMADWHEQAWAWAWNIRQGVYSPPFVAIAGRGSGKSTTAESIITALGARGTRKHALYVRSTQKQANASLANIANILENGPIKEYYPLMADRLISEFGQSRGWNQTMLRTASGFTIVAFGLDSSLRGFKVDDYRPDLICHELGTKIFDPALGRWLKVEDHPGVIALKRSAGYEIKLDNLFESEVVTPEHRYWVRKAEFVKQPLKLEEPTWVEAKDLKVREDYIGFPLDQTVIEPQPISVVSFERDGLLLKKKETFAVPLEFEDPDWWWIFGLWWRRGGFSADKITIFFQPHDYSGSPQRFLEILSRYGISAERENYPSHYRFVFKHDTFFRWFKSWTNIADEYRVLPLWIEKIDPAYQRKIVEGYIDQEMYTPRQNKENRKLLFVFKDRPDDLYSLRRLLLRIGILANLRKLNNHARLGEAYFYHLQIAIDGSLDKPVHKLNRKCMSFIADGFLWSRVKEVLSVDRAIFVPIKTESSTYISHFGLSHNCLDDIDSKHDSPGITQKKIETITTSILPAGSMDMTVLAIQNLIINDGIFAKFADGTADFLADRIMVGPIPAVEDLEYIVINNIPKIIGGTPTWEGQSLEICEDQMKLWGVKAFLAEAQHKTGDTEGGTFDGVTYRRIAQDDVPDLARIVCWIDPAVSVTKRSDCQAIQIDGIERVKDPKKRPRIYRLYSWEGIAKPSDMIRRALREATERNCEKIGVETNQGGDLWEDEYMTIAGDMLDEGEIDYIPKFDSEKAGAHTGGKQDRAERMLTDYTRNYIIHVEGTHDTLEGALGRFPLIAPDDLVDAAYWAWYDLRSKDKWRGKPRFGKIKQDRIMGNKNTAGRPSRANHLRRLGLR